MRLHFFASDILDKASQSVVIRHGEDDNHLTPSLDQPLSANSIEEVEQLAIEVSKFCSCPDDRNSGVTIFHSPKIRTRQTASIVASFCKLAKIDVNIVMDNDLREMDQGRFIIRNHVDGNDYPPLMQAWSAFQKKMVQSDLLYRFGDPLINRKGEAEFPELLDWFLSFGENQKEFSLRLYRFLSTILLPLKGRIPIIVAHQALASRIQKIFHVLNNADIEHKMEPGYLVCELERTGSRVSLNHACGAVVPKPINMAHVISILSREIDFLENI
ncbi:MAG: phosphoglycerate mutase family protein [Patescibacteria group bacterium]|nr:phosphoglycerate mutase family protein [Patescibacteria group bacterium]